MLSSHLQSKSRSFVNRIKSFNLKNSVKNIRENYSTKKLLSQVLSIFLMVTMMTSSTPAAPEYVIASANEMGRDIRYAYLTNTYLAQLSDIDFTDNVVYAFFFGKGKQQRVARIEINPGNGLVTRLGEQVVFTAVAYDSRNNPIQGIGFNWRAIDINKRTPQLNLLNGIFEPQFSGGFNVTAEAGGISSTVFVYVVKDTKFKALKEHDENDRTKGQGKVKTKKYSKDVEDEMAKPRPAPVNNSSRMSQQEANELERKIKSFDQPRQAKTEVEKPNSETVASSELRYIVSPDGNENSFGNVTNPASEASNNAPVVIAYLEEVTGTNATGWIYDTADMGFYNYVNFTVDGPLGVGTPLFPATPANLYGSTGTNHHFSYPIPSQYHDGQPHTIYAYAWYNMAMNLLPGGPRTFTISGSGGGTNANWNNSNFTTADDPGKLPGSNLNWHGSGDDPIVKIPVEPEPGTSGAGSGNFSFSAPIVSVGGRGMSMGLSLNYNSLLWHQAGTNISYDIDKGWPAPGWNLGFGKLMDMGSNGGSMLESADGSRHSYDGTIQAGSGGYSTYYGHTTDGSFIDYVSYRGPSGITSGTAWMPDGTIITYGAAANGVAYPTQIKDRHGNFISISYINNAGPRIATITDSLGRNIQFNYDTSNRLITVTGPGYNGNPSQTYVRLHYTSQTLGAGATFSGLTTQVRNQTVDQIDSIFYPVKKTGYWFGEGMGGANGSYSSYGMLAKVIEQRGMDSTGTTNNQGMVTQGVMTRQMIYNYPMTASSLTGAPQYSTMTETWSNMDTPYAAVTSYNVNNTSTPRVTTITLPDGLNGTPGTQIKLYSENLPNQWNDGMLFKTETIAPGGAVLNRQEMSWAIGYYGSARLTQTLNTDERGQITKQTFAYGPYYNQVTSVSDYGYGATPYRTSTTTFENGQNYRGYYTTINGMDVFSYGRHIFNLPKISQLLDAGGVSQSRTDANYDQNQFALVNTPGVVQYDETYNPHTTQTTQGGCIQWEYDPYTYESYCVAYEEISIHDPATQARGNVTETIVYENAAAPSGAISYVNTYDITGNLRTATTNCCQQMAFHYSTLTQYSQPDWHRKGSPTDTSAQITESATYDPNTGVVLTSTSFDGQTTSYAYDSIARPIQTTISTNGKTTTQYFDATLSVTQTAMDEYNNITSQSTTFVNGRGQPISTQQLAGSGTNIVQTKYDVMGRQSHTSLPFPSTGSPTAWTTVAYDALSRPTQTTAPDGSTNKTFYNEIQRPGSVSQTEKGSTIRSQDAWGRERWARTDGFGRLVEVVEPKHDGNGSVFEPDSMPTSYSYDTSDQLTFINQGGQQRVFAYDSLGRMTRQKLAEQSSGANNTGSLNPAGQYVGPGNGIWTDAFFYDTRSNLVQRTDARGVKTNFNYQVGAGPDPLNRLQSVSYDKTTADTSKPIWDAPPVSINYVTTAGRDKTRVASVVTGVIGNIVSTETNTYDTHGRIQFYSISMFGKSAMTTEYGYDTANRLTSITYPNAYGTPLSPKVITPSYDNASRLMQMNVNGGAQLSGLVYNPLGQVTQLVTGAATGNADVEEYSYDPLTTLLTNQKVKKANTNQTILNLTYGYARGNSKGSLYGKTGNLTKIVNELDRNKDRIYEFDTLGRLAAAKGGVAAGGSGVANWTQNYSYDRWGNRLAVTSSGVTANSQAIPNDGLPTLAYDISSNRINTAGYEYDLAGNQTRGQAPDGSWQKFEYDAAGRLIKVKTNAGADLETYSYGSTRQRLRTVSGSITTYYAWGSSSVACEYTETTGNTATFKLSKSYIYSGSRLLSTQTWNGSAETTEFHHPDRLGTKLVTNNAANTSTEQNVLPFGTVISSETTANTNQKFTSYDRSDVVKLDYAVNRSYSFGQSRFTTVDPIGMASVSVGSPQSLNLYAYVSNSPIDFVDPLGLDDIDDPNEIVGISYTYGRYIRGGGSSGGGGGGTGDDSGLTKCVGGRCGGGGTAQDDPPGKDDDKFNDCIETLLTSHYIAHKATVDNFISTGLWAAAGAAVGMIAGTVASKGNPTAGVALAAIAFGFVMIQGLHQLGIQTNANEEKTALDFGQCEKAYPNLSSGLRDKQAKRVNDYLDSTTSEAFRVARDLLSQFFANPHNPVLPVIPPVGNRVPVK